MNKFKEAETVLVKVLIVLPDSECAQVEHPEQSTQNASNPRSVLYLIPKHRDLGVMGMTEILTALQLLHAIGSPAGAEPTTIAFADTFEAAFGFRYNDIYDRQTELFRRKLSHLTKTLDAMKAALVKEYRRRQVLKKSGEE